MIWTHIFSRKNCRWIWKLLPRQDWARLRHISWFAASFGCSVGGWIALRAGVDYVSASPFSARVVEVPEPWSAALLGVALVGLAAVRWRRV